ncbi:MAG: glycine cleavage system aminomethyltransferase GcvT [Armatimonadota bacterium]
MTDEMGRTRLYDEHLALGGRLVPFAGWALPVQYEATGALREHRAVREAAGLFDIDHMGQLIVSGPDAGAFLNAVLTVDVRAVPRGKAQYALLPYDDGGLVDDVMLYRLPEAWWIIVNAANRAKDLRWLIAHAGAFRVTIEDLSERTYMLALQGPRAQPILQTLTAFNLDRLPYHAVARTEVAGVPMLVAATGYTGEYGYELYFPAEEAVPVWRALLEAGRPAGLLPCGLAARDSLRFEAGLPLYGSELGPDIDPFAAGLGRFVQFDPRAFVGRAALLKIMLEGPARKLVGFEMTEPAVPRAGYPVLIDGQPAGTVTSGMKSPTLDKFLGMAFVPAQQAVPGTEVEIVVREKAKKAVIVKRPFYTPAYRRAPERVILPQPARMSDLRATAVR